MSMSNSDSKLARRVARRAAGGESSRRSKTAGEVRFVTDRPGDDERQIDESSEFEYDPKHLKPLSKVLWQLSCSLGHLISAHSSFTKMKATRISPDGKLGGKGYIQPITDIRTSMTECIESMSSIVDTLDDEVRGPHWTSDEGMSEDDQEEIEETIDEAEEVRENPEEFSDDEYREEVLEDED